MSLDNRLIGESLVAIARFAIKSYVRSGSLKHASPLIFGGPFNKNQGIRKIFVGGTLNSFYPKTKLVFNF